ncbi:hypothetical protein [Ammoniphilus sp. YIM 78166]|uniref:hypothetical protein n=1 Tax=Ammoniphilus sp. YIM 78166 TaxID=1644106 RepID=UPI00106F9CE7|nr:hypothetical protein [Ammoniphilus sp. YIM 78166]
MIYSGPRTTIFNFRIENVTDGGSVNLGPSILKGFQANQKINTGEIAIGDEFLLGCPSPEGNEEENS